MSYSGTVSTDPGAEEPVDTNAGCPLDHDFLNGNFDQHSMTYREHSREILKHYRENDPLPWSDTYGGFRLVTKYDDVAFVSRDDATFSSNRNESEPHEGVNIPPTLHRFGFIEMDPPVSLEYRRGLIKLFTAAYAEKSQPFIKRFAQEALDDHIEKDEFDIVAEYTDRLPAMTTLHMLGLDAREWRRYADFFHHFVAEVRTADGYGERYGPGNWVMENLHQEIQDRHINPRDDGLSYIMALRIGDEPPTEEEIVESLMLILVGGFDTSSALLANSLIYLHENSGDRRRLIDDPALIPSACEEFLRYDSPIQHLSRTGKANCALAGRNLKPGDRLMLSYASANLDEDTFDNADKVIIDRFPNRHQAFGHGTHRCAGSYIARTEFAIGLNEVLTRMPDYEVVMDERVRYTTIGSNNGWLSVPVRPNLSAGK
jgi:cytochrome P450